jgi:hypothetical protein
MGRGDIKSSAKVMDGLGIRLAGVMVSTPDRRDLRGEPVLLQEALYPGAVVVADHGTLHTLAVQRV